ncbi:MAG: hypothetical protein WA182_07395 [Candidatus Sulfotelmatobacter sp.]
MSRADIFMAENGLRDLSRNAKSVEHCCQPPAEPVPAVPSVANDISLFNIPFGTAVGVYTLWVLLPAQSQEEYDATAAARAA